MITATGSQLDRIARCPPSGALPQVIDLGDDDEDDRSQGTIRHRFLQRASEVGREAALEEVDEEWRANCADIDLAKIADQLKLSHEVPIAYNWAADTARLLYPVAPRVYEIDPSCEVAMTTDIVGEGNRHVYIGDYKGPHAWLPDPALSYQLGAAAVAFSRLFKARRATLEYIRIRDDGTPVKFKGELDMFGLDDVAEKISKMMGGLPALRSSIDSGIIPDVFEGPWCRYCHSKQHCPGKTALVRSVLGNPTPIPYSLPLTPADAVRIYRMFAPARAALKQAEGVLAEYAKLTPISLGVDPDGSERFYGELSRPGNEELDGSIVHRVITEMYDGETANKSVTYGATKAAIGDAIRGSLKPDEKITIQKDKVIARVRELGGSSRKMTTTTTEFTVAPGGQTKARKRK
jgi:hypothetical protein